MKNIQLEFTPWQIRFLIKIIKNYLKIRRKKYYDYSGGMKQFNNHPDAIVLMGLIDWMEDKLIEHENKELDEEILRLGNEAYAKSLKQISEKEN